MCVCAKIGFGYSIWVSIKRNRQNSHKKQNEFKRKKLAERV